MIELQVNNRRPIAVERGEKLLDILTRAGYPVIAACGGKRQCGLCRIKIDHPREPSRTDKKLISPDLIKQGYRLACQYRVNRPIRISLPDMRSKRKESLPNIGLALDLGTTIVKGASVDMNSGRTINRAKIYNLQNNFGADIITRISAALEGRYDQLRMSLLKSVEQLKARLNIANAASTVAVGNPAMSSFYLGKRLDGLARHPFRSEVDAGFRQPEPPVFVFPAIAGFVGGDTLAGILAAGLHQTTKPTLYIDLGTNGEVALASGNRIYVTSTAAGPAFEGVGISCGCMAIPGAVNRIFESRFSITFRTIGNKPPIGYCASGLIDLLGIALKWTWLSPDGRVRAPIGRDDLILTQEDVRNLQLAIAAIHAGIELLLKKSGIRSKKIEKIILSGEFGATLNPRALVKIGLLPDTKAKILGTPDTALKGALLVLKNGRQAARLTAIKEKCVHVDIAREPSFERTYINSLTLAPWK